MLVNRLKLEKIKSHSTFATKKRIYGRGIDTEEGDPDDNVEDEREDEVEVGVEVGAEVRAEVGVEDEGESGFCIWHLI